MKNLVLTLIAFVCFGLTMNAQTPLSAQSQQFGLPKLPTQIQKSHYPQIHQRILADTSLMDSIIYISTYSPDNAKYIYSYDANMNQSAIFEYKQNTAGNWTLNSKETTTYNSNRDILEKITYIKQQSTGAIIENLKESYTYNANNLLTSFFAYSWDVVENTWILSSKKLYEYDSNGQMTKLSSYIWDISTSSWTNGEKNTFVYDVNGNVSETINYLLDYSLNGWVPFVKCNKTYNTNGNLIEDYYYIWNVNTTAWINSSKSSYLYDNNNRVIETVNINWHNPSQTWINNDKTLQQYDANGNMIDYQAYMWSTNNQWDLGYYTKLIITYNIDNQITEQIQEIWDNISTTNLNFIHNSKINLTYNIDGYLTNGVLNLWDNTSNSWIYYDQRYYYYSSPNGVAIEPTQNINAFQIYPNPAQNELHLKNIPLNTHLAVYDMYGRLCMTTTLQTETLDIRHLPKGIYNLKIADYQAGLKFVKE